jgi:hypothetical protein
LAQQGNGCFIRAALHDVQIGAGCTWGSSSCSACHVSKQTAEPYTDTSIQISSRFMTFDFGIKLGGRAVLSDRSTSKNHITGYTLERICIFCVPFKKFNYHTFIAVVLYNYHAHKYKFWMFSQRIALRSKCIRPETIWSHITLYGKHIYYNKPDTLRINAALEQY